MSFKLFTDGGSRGNPGNSAIAYIILQDELLLDFGAKFVGTATNNFAEYNALIEGLKLALKHTKSIECYLDSELVVKQLNGEYKISSVDIKPLATKVNDLKKDFESIKFIHVRREQNKIADKLVNIILDTKESNV
jgi:ribonuclease HI